MKIKRLRPLGLVAFTVLLAGFSGPSGCKDSDQQQQEQQEVLLAEGTARTGMPAIKNFRERNELKDILELRDQSGLVTFTYLYNAMKGELVPLCDSLGYGFPAATQFTNPMKKVSGHELAIPQADPNGLFSPSSAEGTWIICKDPGGPEAKPVYVEERIIVSPFRLGGATAEKK